MSRLHPFVLFGIFLVLPADIGSAAEGLVGNTSSAPLSITSDTWHLSQTFRPPNRGAPAQTVGGAARSGCIEEADMLLALTPATTLGLTTSGHPTLFWYVPATNAQTAEILVRDLQENEIYHSVVPVPPSGIVSFTWPETGAALEVGKTYEWFFSLICQPDDRTQDVFISAGIQRVEVPAELATQLQQASLRDRSHLYATNGIWHDTFAILLELRRSQPNDATLISDWEELLNSAGLNQVIEKPLSSHLLR
jgi:hypothetical protein